MPSNSQIQGGHPAKSTTTDTKGVPDNQGLVVWQSTWTQAQWDAFESIKRWARIPEHVNMARYSND